MLRSAQRWILSRVLIALIAPGLAVAAEAAEMPCQGCHADVVGDGDGHPLAAHRAAAPRCTDCHRNADGHPAGGKEGEPMMAFDSEPAETRAAVCQACHASMHRSGAGAHQRLGIACDGCHRVHRTNEQPLPAEFQELDAASATCVSCHAQAFAEFSFNERHRLAEGVVTCTSCHDPHAAGERALLGDLAESPCAECHRSVAGPFVFEHAASRVEGCNACHVPHGSPNRHLLTHQRVGALCYSCHALVPQFHIGFAPGAPARFDEDTVCTNCHTAIHGSNFDRDFLR